MPRPPRKQDLTFYLLKPDAPAFDACLSKPEELQKFELLPQAGFTGCLYTRAPRSSNPAWFGFVRDIVPDVPEMRNASTAAVLFLQVDGERFAITFGYGRNLLELDMLVRDFGLRAALNTVHPETLRSVDARTFEELSVARKTQTSRLAALESFSINRSEEILKAVTGRPADANLGHRITGSDAVKLTCTPSVARLPDKCRQLAAAYRSTTYKDRYDFIDHMSEERDGPTISQLDALLLQKLRSGDYDRMHMAPPEVSDWTEIDSFIFSRGGTEASPDLDPAAYVSIFAAPADVTLVALKKDKVGVHFTASADPNFKWRVYDAIVCEVQHNGALYVLTSGCWYRIESAFAEKIATDIAGKVVNAPFLCGANAGETEPDYNARVAAANGHFLFDAKPVRPNGALTDIEFCDLVTADKRLVHVKRKSRSSTLSHLFAQGLVSAETFYADSVFLQRLKNKAQAEISAEAAAAIPDAKPTPSDWTVVYAIILEGRRPWPDSLPFFAQLNFRNTAERLVRMGYKVELVRIPVADSAALEGHVDATPEQDLDAATG